MKSSNFATLNEKDFLLMEKQYSEITLQRYTSFAIQCANYTVFSDLKKKGYKLGH